MRRLAVPCLALLGIALAGGPLVFAPVPRLAFNGSRSAAVGFYRIVPATVAPGELALLRPPEPMRRMLARRGYLPPGLPLIKRVAAGPGDEVCRARDAVFVNGERVATAAARDRLGRPMPGWAGCRTLRAHEVFVLQDHPHSFDSRYFGPVDRSRILGRAVPIWILGGAPGTE